MNPLRSRLIRFGLLTEDLDYHLLRASMVIIFLSFGYQKWFEYEARVLIPFIGNGPLIFWMYAVFGIRGASWFLGASEWLFAALLFCGLWNKKAGILGALGCCFAMIGTVTIIPFMPDGWDAAAGFPAMKGNVAFLMNPVKAEQMRDVALAGELMPQKSTDFYPKLLSGLAIYALD